MARIPRLTRDSMHGLAVLAQAQDLGRFEVMTSMSTTIAHCRLHHSTASGLLRRGLARWSDELHIGVVITERGRAYLDAHLPGQREPRS